MDTVLPFKRQSKGRPSRLIDPHGFESIGSILRRMRGGAESDMTSAFDPTLSQKLDFLLVLEQHDEEADDDCA